MLEENGRGRRYLRGHLGGVLVSATDYEQQVVNAIEVCGYLPATSRVYKVDVRD